MSPNEIYQDPKLYDGIAVTSADIIKIFADVSRKLKVHRSMIKLQLDNELHIYAIYSPEMITKLNGTMVVVRAASLDMKTVYLFDAKTDAFLCAVKEFIPVYGDKKSMEESGDKLKVFAHSQKLKAAERFIETKGNESDEFQEEMDLSKVELNFAN
jgi:hypothetical protein